MWVDPMLCVQKLEYLLDYSQQYPHARGREDRLGEYIGDRVEMVLGTELEETGSEQQLTVISAAS